MFETMSDGLLSLLALVAAIAGMAAFALANDIHWRQLFGLRPQSAATRTACNTSGAVLLGLSLLFCAIADPITMALLVWPMMLGVAAAIVATFFTARSRSQPPR